MTRRRAVIAVLLLTLVAVSALGFFQFRTPRAVRRFDQLQLGMTRAEVVMLLGEPFGTGGTVTNSFSTVVLNAPPVRVLEGSNDSGRVQSAFWPVDDCWAYIGFDAHDGVICADLFASTPPPSFLDRLCGWLGL